MDEGRSERIRFWQHHVDEYLHGELTLREYCNHHQLNRSTFGYWRRQVGEQARRSVPKPSVQIVRLDVVEVGESAAARNATPFELVLGNGRLVRVPVDFDAAALERLVSVVEKLR